MKALARCSGSFLFLAVSVLCARAQAPANDNFANATVLTGTNIALTGNNSNATTEVGENTGGGFIQYQASIWYDWTAPASGEVYWATSLPVSIPNLHVVANLYNGTAVSSLSALPGASDGGYIVTAGQDVKVKVSSQYALGTGATGPFNFALWLTESPTLSTNDNFAQSIPIVAPTYHFDGGINGATVEAGEPLPDPSVTQTLWWNFQPASNGLLRLVFNSSSFNSWVGVYEGTAVSALTVVNPDAGGIYRLQAGHNYAVQFAAAPMAVTAGAFSLDATFTPQDLVNNDLFANAVMFGGSNVVYAGTLAGSSSEPGEPITGTSNTIWIGWTAPFTGRAQYVLNSAPHFEYSAVYTGSAVSNLQAVPLVGLVNNVVAFLAIEGTTYYFQFSGGSDNVIFTMGLAPFAQAPYDNFANAQVLVGPSPSGAPSSVVGATMEPGEPQHMGPVPQKSVWWKWQSPYWQTATFHSGGALIPNAGMWVYAGNSVSALTLVTSGTNVTPTIPVTGGETFYIAEAVPTNVIGDLTLGISGAPPDVSAHIVPGNLLQQPSWEGTALQDTTYWHWTGGLGGYVNETHANRVDGQTWPVLVGGQKIWQTIPTIPGHYYEVRFACLFGGPDSGGSGDANVQVLWDTNSAGTFNSPAGWSGTWNWADLTFTATNTSTQVTFYNLSRTLEMDAFSVVDQTAAPAIVQQPASASTVVGGSAAFVVGVNGSAPLSYQWYFNSNVMSGQTNALLLLNSVSTNDAGNYQVIVSNAFGSTNSAVAALQVNTSPFPIIVWQPYGGTLPVNTYFSFNVAAIGPPPLSYQWYFNNVAITNETNQALVFASLQTNNAGTYTVSVQNPNGTVFSLPAHLYVTSTNVGGGTIFFHNFTGFGPSSSSNAPVYDIDGTTLLAGTNFLAQLYAGPSLATIHPAGSPQAFQVGPLAGYFNNQVVTLADVPPFANAVAQVRVWEAGKGSSYEQARALGGKFGKSAVLNIQTGSLPPPPTTMTGLQSFSLQAGLPFFNDALIQFVEQLPDGSLVWSLTGEAGYQYLIEENAGNNIWQPYQVITNTTGTVNFTNLPGTNATFFRSRILD